MARTADSKRGHFLSRYLARRSARRLLPGLAAGVAKRLIENDGKCPVGFARNLWTLAEKGLK